MNLKKVRKNKHFTLKKIENLTGLRTGSISNIENGRRKPSYETIKKICKALDADPKELFFNEDEQEVK